MKMVSQATYARIYGVSKQAVSKAVKVGRLKLVDGKVDANIDLESSRRQTPNQKKTIDDDNLGVELLRARVGKLMVDAEASQQKLDRYKDELLRQFSALAVEAFYDAFAGFKNDLVALRLNEDQLRELRVQWDKCVHEWVKKMVKLDVDK